MRNLTTNQKLWGSLVAAWIAMLLIAAWGAWSTRTVMTEERQNKAREQTAIVVSMLSDVAAQVERGGMTLDAGQLYAGELLKSMRYDEGRGYFFVFDQDLYNVSHPTITSGTPLEDYKDIDGRLLFREFLDAANAANGQAFVDYRWKHAGTGEPEPKRSYIKRFDAWGWYIGTGVYVADIDKAFYAELLRDRKSVV